MVMVFLMLEEEEVHAWNLSEIWEVFSLETSWEPLVKMVETEVWMGLGLNTRASVDRLEMFVDWVI